LKKEQRRFIQTWSQAFWDVVGEVFKQVLMGMLALPCAALAVCAFWVLLYGIAVMVKRNCGYYGCIIAMEKFLD